MRIELDQMKQKHQYYLFSTGGSSAIFAEDYELFTRICSSVVRELLNFGGLPYLFEKKMSVGSHIRHAVPGAAKTAVEIAAGLGGGALGGAYGFVRGFFGLENPFDSAQKGFNSGIARGAKLADVAVNYITGLGASEHFSVLNYGHPYGECSFITPWKVGQLAKDAKENEQKIFPRTKGW